MNISAPLMSITVHAGNREIYLNQLREAGVTRVFLAIGTPIRPIPAHVFENVSFFKEAGMEVGIWIDTVGHGTVLTHAENLSAGDFPPMVNLDGKIIPHTFCPTDAAFRRYIAEYVADLTATGTDIVMLDDDFRLSQHGGVALCCACDAHLKRIGELLGETITLEELRPYLTSGKKNRYRDAWTKAQGECLTIFAKEIRAAVDRVSPDTTVCFCTSLTVWNVDHADVEGIARILAGKNRPILRATGAPYWAYKKGRQHHLAGTFSIARMLGAFASEWDFDLMSEGDVYPRPRYTCPGSYLELYDGVLRADGSYNGILKYMFDYTAGPLMETGYLRLHNEDREMLESLETIFPKGANRGVRVLTAPHTYRDADLDLSHLAPHSPIVNDGTLLGVCSIPTVFRGEGICVSLFGENARRVDLSLLRKGAILDAVSATILHERSVDVGLAEARPLRSTEVNFLTGNDPEFRSMIIRGNARLCDAVLKEGATPILFATAEGKTVPLAYTYENREGQRFLVFLYEGESLQDDSSFVGNSGLISNPVIQQALLDTVPWVARESLPACSKGNPSLYLMCGEEDGSLSVALFNCFADRLTNPEILLKENYGRIQCFGCEATLSENRVTLTSPLYGFSFAAFRVFKS